jgi:LysM repeat protein
MIKVKKTAKEAYADFAKWVDKPSSKAPKAPWVYNLNIAGCALGYGWFVGFPRKIWTVSAWVSIAKSVGTYRPANGSGKFGDAVIFDWSGAKTGHDHIGFFIKEDKNYVWNISANSTGGLVRIKKTSKRYVAGYGTVVKFKEEPAAKPIVNSPASPVETVKPVVTPTTPEVVKPVVGAPVAPKPIVISNPKPVVPVNAKPKHKFIVINKGDTYWGIARRELGIRNIKVNYPRIAAKSLIIQRLNNKKALFAGKTVRVK